MTPARGLGVRRRMAAVSRTRCSPTPPSSTMCALGLRFRGVARRAHRARVAEWLERLGIAGLARARPARSPAARRSAPRSRAPWCSSPSCCSSTSRSPPSISRPARRSSTIWAPFSGVARTTTVLVTHDRAEALALGDRVAVVLAGRLAPGGRAARCSAPASEEVARFVGVETILDVQRRRRWRRGLAMLEAGKHDRRGGAAGGGAGSGCGSASGREDVTLIAAAAGGASERAQPSRRPSRADGARRSPRLA